MVSHSTGAQEVLKEYGTNEEKGLSEKTAGALLSEHGENRLREAKKKTLLQRFAAQFKDAMIIILLVAAAISFGIVIYENEPGGIFEPLLIVLIVIINAVIGVAQESKAEKALDALKNMSAPHAKVIRDGEERVIDAAGLVPGDIIRLEAGDFVPADARLLSSFALKAEESALTGESVPSEKDANAIVEEKAPIGDRINMVYSGCSITYGAATAVVTATGMQTEMGKIANLLENDKEEKTPLQQKLAQLGKYLGFAAIAACVVIFIVGIINGIPPIEIFMVSVSLAVSAIPEGLPAIVTVVLSIGVQRMVKKNAIIRRLPAVETLGSASVICSDKTGTLTLNQMTLVDSWLPETGYEKITDGVSEPTRKLLTYATLCCDGTARINEDGSETHIGDPTETAIVMAALKNGMPKEALLQKYPRFGEIPFDSDRKLMSVVNEIDGKNVVIVKGAFDMLVNKCTNFDKTAEQATNDMSAKALRVLAVAYKEIPATPEVLDPEELEQGLNFMGLVGMIDPPREEAKAAVATCREAGITPVMITGDHVVTASAIAKELGIFREGDKAITGAQLDAMSDDELDKDVRNISVYARVSPENKIRIVKAWQKKGEVVSMTGDGVNDAPALKAADIGCAMGITGTDVAKGAADMTLTDDNFATIVDAVREGRGIYANIKKVVGFLLGTNIGEVLSVFFAMMIWHKSPFLSMQLLWINLVTDSLPAIALGMEAVESDVMQQKPKPKNESIFADGLGVRVVLQGIMFAAITLFAFLYGEKVMGDITGGRTLAFMVLALTQVVQAFNMRSNNSLFASNPFSNKTLNLAAIVSVLLIALVLFTPLNAVFGMMYINPSLYLIGLALALIPIPVMEVVKLVHRRVDSKK